MIISDDTLKVLQNFAMVNPNLVLKPGQKVKQFQRLRTLWPLLKSLRTFHWSSESMT
jgi:hypothetical protein